MDKIKLLGTEGLKLSNIKDLLARKNEEEIFNNTDEKNTNGSIDIEKTSNEKINVSTNKTGIPKNKEGGNKVYMKYEDGEVMYLDEDRVNLKDEVNQNLKSKLSSLVESILKSNKNIFNFKRFINMVFTIFILVFIVFVYVYYFKDSGNYNTNNSFYGKEVYNIEFNADEHLNKLNDNDVVKSMINTGSASNLYDTGMEEIIDLEKVIADIKEINTKELEKVYNYINLKANRVSTISSIKNYKENKENLYLLIHKNINLIEDEKKFQETESLLIKSISMSNEFLEAFEGDSTKSALKSIIEKYK